MCALFGACAMQSKIFISCSSKDAESAHTICAAIEARGYSCWVASRDVRPGQNFQEEIVHAIRKSPIMVLVFSANANNSNEIKKELALASQSNLTVIPVRIEDVTPDGAFVYELATRQWIDLFAGWDRQMNTLLQHIAAALPAHDAAGTMRTSAPPLSSASPIPPTKINRGPLYLAAGLAGGFALAGTAVFLLRPSPIATPSPEQQMASATPSAQHAAAPAPQPVKPEPTPARAEPASTMTAIAQVKKAAKPPAKILSAKPVPEAQAGPPPVASPTNVYDPSVVNDSVRLVSISATHTAPPYPPISQRLGEEGKTTLLVTIGPAGIVTNAVVDTSSGSERLDAAFIEHAKLFWRWQPPTVDGRPVSVRTRIRANWHLIETNPQQ